VELIHQHSIVIRSTCKAGHTIPVSITVNRAAWIHSTAEVRILGGGRRVEGFRTRIVPVAVVDVPVEFLEDGHLHLGGDAGVVLFIWFKNIFIDGIVRGE
jgi:hypothetical protein